MTPTRALVVAAMLVVLTPSVLAADAPFTARGLTLDGAATLDGPSDAFLATGTGDAPFTWTLTAESAVIERTTMPWREVRDPTGRPLVAKYDDAQTRTERLTFTQVHVRSVGTEDVLGLFARGDGLRATLVTSQDVALAPAQDPVFQQGPPPEYESPATPLLSIVETVPGDYVLTRASGATFTLEGDDLALTLVGPDYALDAAEGEYAGRTGWYETQSLPGYAEGLVERQVIRLTHAFLRVDAPLDAQLASHAPRLAFQGALVAQDPDGAFPLDLPTTTGKAWTGQGALELAPDAGRLLARSPSDVHAAGAGTVTRSPSVVPYAVAAFLLVAVALAALVLLRRRRGEDEDPVALALLAMEERRWEDALPHLDRALHATPRDAKLLVDRALCLEESGRLSAAREGYEAALAAEPGNAETHYYYARTLARLRNPTSALAHLARALTMDERLAELARREAAFAPFKDHPQFGALLE